MGCAGARGVEAVVRQERQPEPEPAKQSTADLAAPSSDGSSWVTMWAAVKARERREHAKKCIGQETQWTKEQADRLQLAVDELFGDGQAELLGLEYSFSIADPLMDGCPLVGCSSGFTQLVGYGLEEIVGRNCRFLIDPVPKELRCQKNRNHARDYCNAIAVGQDYFVPEEEREDWMPKGRPGDELLCFQRNARKSGELFWNLFYMKTFDLGTAIDELRPYIVALQSELPNGSCTSAELGGNLHLLEKRMTHVASTLAKLFFLETNMRRDMEPDEDDGFDRQFSAV